MGPETILTAGLEFLKKTALIYLAVMLSVVFVFAIPADWQNYLGLSSIMSNQHRGYVSGVGVLSFFLWLTSLWPIFQTWTKNRKEKLEKEKKSKEALEIYRKLPSGARAIIGYCITTDVDRALTNLGNPGAQEAMDTGWFWTSERDMHFHRCPFNSL